MDVMEIELEDSAMTKKIQNAQQHLPTSSSLREPHYILKVVGVVVLLTLVAVKVYSGEETQTMTSSISINPKKDPRNMFHIEKGMVKFIVDFQAYESQEEGQTDNTALAADGRPMEILNTGVHSVTLVVSKSCPDPGFWARLEGTALVPIVLKERQDNQWGGHIHVPLEGDYELVSYWYGCDGTQDEQRTILKEFITRGAKNIKGQGVKMHETFDYLNHRERFPAEWVSTRIYDRHEKFYQHQPYIFANLGYVENNSHMIKVGNKLLQQEVLVGKLSVDQFYTFDQLSHFDTICFMGSRTMEEFYESFINVKKELFPNKKPHIFTMYPIHSFSKPDAKWSDGQKQEFRKCTQIYVVVDEFFKPLKQADFIQEVRTFLVHLQKIFPQDVIPIWILTMLESPSKAAVSHYCQNGTLPRSSHHPCNVALHKAFEQESLLGGRVRLMDNVDITLPQLGQNKDDVYMMLAARTMFFIGSSIYDLRKTGMAWNRGGLAKNGNLTVDFSTLTPYEGW